MLDSRDFQMIAFTYIGTPFPFALEQIFGNCSDGNSRTPTSPGSTTSSTEIGRTVDVTERTALANQADVLLWDNASTLPLYQRPGPAGDQRQHRQLRRVRLPDPGQVGGRRLDGLTLTRH